MQITKLNPPKHAHILNIKFIPMPVLLNTVMTESRKFWTFLTLESWVCVGLEKIV